MNDIEEQLLKINAEKTALQSELSAGKNTVIGKLQNVTNAA